MSVAMQFLRDNWLFLLIVGGMVLVWLLLRTPGSQLESTASFDQQVGAGQPVVVEFYSNT
ncbi:MAG: hypothetical protein JW900_12710 [Anaerolineae bacterium]|nr:hypothetical protein [Anaerolineae bacterium]